MLSVNNLDIRFGDKYLFKNISVQVYQGNRIGLIGVNGVGKSTLLKIMAGVESVDDGVISRSRHFTIGYLPQESNELFSGRSLYKEAETAFTPLLVLQNEQESLHKEMAVIAPESPQFQDLLRRHGELQQRLDGSDIYALEGRIERVLLGLGFSREDMGKPAFSFSGGWQMRLKLAKIMLEEPSLLLLDEPTNHLDLESLTWVEKFLNDYNGSMVIISHDRTFLDKTTELTWELSFGRIDVYKGNYSFYIREKEERRKIEKGAYDNQQAKIRQTMRFVERFRSKATKARQVQSRVRQLEKLELIEIAGQEQQIKFRFPPAPASGRDVLKLAEIDKSYGSRQVFSGVELLLNRGDKVAVVGVNGAGKSTLLRIIAGQTELDSGSVTFGAHVRMTYFGQHQAQDLVQELTVLETMALAGEGLTITQQRSLLGAFLFRGDDVDKKVAVLSGGEKSRLALAKMIAVPANLMLLDEPTNHLDISSQEVLREAMTQYDGTIIVVSHNRYFVDSFVNKVLEVRGGRLTLYEGNVADYLRKKEKLEAAAVLKQEKDQPQKAGEKQGSGSREERKKQKRLEAARRQERSRRARKWLRQLDEAEQRIEELESEKDALEATMADPGLYGDQEKWSEICRAYQDCQRRLDRNYSRWEQAQQAIDIIDSELELPQ